MSSVTGTRLPDWLAHRAATTPHRLALVASERTWSFAELDAAATRMARQLATLGARAGGRVAMLLNNGATAAILAHATRRLGAVLVPLNVRLSDAELAWQVADAGVRVLVVEERTGTLAERARREIESLVIVAAERLDDVAEQEVPLRLELDADETLAIIYTSGTTGRPKGAMLTVGNFWWSAIGSALNLGTHADDRWLACLPLFHVGGL